MTTTSTTKADRYSNRAPKGGAVSPVNGLWYQGGRWMPCVTDASAPNPVPLSGATRQVPWAARLRRAELARIEDQIAGLRGGLESISRKAAVESRGLIRALSIEHHVLMVERSASAIIDRNKRNAA